MGKPSTPTPPGRFWVREKFPVNPPVPLYGPYAIGTSDYSTTETDWPGGGIIGIHGTDQPNLIPGDPSHGCVRLQNPEITKPVQARADRHPDRHHLTAVTAPELRCFGGDDPLYRDYHDHEWGRPVRDERRLYERLCLEAFQSGLSWLTILRKRDGFRAAFAGFDPEAVAAFDERDERRLLADAAIVRNRAKIAAAITNARATVALRDGRRARRRSCGPTRRPGGRRPPPSPRCRRSPISRARWPASSSATGSRSSARRPPTR